MYRERERERGCSTENRGSAGERERDRERTEDAQGRERERARELSFLARCVSHTRLAPTSICYGTFQRKEVKYKTTENFHFIFLPSPLLFLSFFALFYLGLVLQGTPTKPWWCQGQPILYHYPLLSALCMTLMA